MISYYYYQPDVAYYTLTNVRDSIAANNDAKILGYGMIANLISHSLPFYLSGLATLQSLYMSTKQEADALVDKVEDKFLF